MTHFVNGTNTCGSSATGPYGSQASHIQLEGSTNSKCTNVAHVCNNSDIDKLHFGDKLTTPPAYRVDETIGKSCLATDLLICHINSD